MTRKKLTVIEKFKQRTVRNTDTLIINGHHCLDYTGGYSNVGYGWVLDDDNVMKLAHRKSYELHCGSIPEGMLVLHACDRRSCVEPSHLRAGTQKDNAADRKARPKTILTDIQRNEIKLDMDNYNVIARKYNITRSDVKSIKGITK
ncbi:HNH endonuclease [Gluconobacter sp. LMG 1744]|uniref:HNH endonuclease signature motif containing protein n=1 Tax=Gluconobacter cadivus TaxID=2728101 RepID=UPI0018854585|nr:HNH endonuclease signature motif containing protein [Gluconobacter cadivus]MBF0892706.1 HNH endonuclease [Gluconobacter cadivus]